MMIMDTIVYIVRWGVRRALFHLVIVSYFLLEGFRGERTKKWTDIWKRTTKLADNYKSDTDPDGFIGTRERRDSGGQRKTRPSSSSKNITVERNEQEIPYTDELVPEVPVIISFINV